LWGSLARLVALTPPRAWSASSSPRAIDRYRLVVWQREQVNSSR
jgi:hypothetical protein